MAKKKKSFKKLRLFNFDVTGIFSPLDYLNNNTEGFSFDKMMLEIEAAKRKGNFNQGFLNIFNSNFDKILKIQSAKIKDGTSNYSLAKVAKTYIDAMGKVEEMLVEKKYLDKPILKSSLSENKTKESLKEALAKEFALNKDPLKQARYNEEVKEAIKTKLTDGQLAKKLPTPKSTFQDVVMAIAEKKFGPLSNKNQKDIDDYVKNFDIKKESCKKDLQTFANETAVNIGTNGWILYNMNAFGYNINPYDRAALDILSRHIQYSRMFDMGGPFFEIPSIKSSPVRENYQWGLVAAHLDTKPLTLPDPIHVEGQVINQDKEPDAFDIFRQNHGINLNKELFTDILDEVSNMDENKEILYRKAYMETFIRVFDGVDTSTSKIADVASDFENCMQEVIKETHPELTGDDYKFGGLKPKELSEFLHNLNEVDCNLTKKSKDELMTMCDVKDVKDLKVSDAIKFTKEKADEELNTEQPEGVRLANAIGRLSALQQIHMSRPKSFKFFHPFQNRDEKNAIQELKDSIVEIQGAVTEEINRASRGENIFKEGYEENKQGIDNLITNIERNTIVDLDKSTDLKLNDPSLGLSKVKEMPQPSLEIKEPKIEPPQNLVLTNNNNNSNPANK